MSANGDRVPLRRDAERNRQRIVDQTRRLVAQAGLSVSHDDIARAAEVGVGTVYRRFPQRQALFEELFTDWVEDVAQLAGQARDEPDAWSGLTGFLDHVVVVQATDRGMREVLSGSPHAPRLARHAREQVAPIVAELLLRAQQQGTARPEAGLGDVAMVPLLTASVIDHGGDLATARRVLAVLVAGLQAPAASAAPLPGSAAGPDVLDRMLSGAGRATAPPQSP